MSGKRWLLPISGNACLSLFVALFGRSEASCADPPLALQSEKLETRKQPVATPEQQKDIKALIRQLGHKDFLIRDKASRRLVEIGLPALPQLWEGLRNNDPEIRKRCQAAIDEIERRNNFKTVNGVEFSAVTDRVWKIPKPGEETRIKLGLSFTSRRKEKVYLYLFDTIWISLVSPKLGEMTHDGGRDRVRRQLTSQTLGPGQAFSYMYPDAKLSWVGQDLRLVYVDRAPSEYWRIPHLSTGAYLLSFKHSHKSTIVSKDGAIKWQGEATTYPVEVQIK